MYYYAYYDTTTYVVQGVYQFPTEITMAGYVQITQAQYENGNLTGKIYNPETGEFDAPNEWVCNSDQVQYTDTGNTTLTEKLNAIDAAIANVETIKGDDGASAYEIAVANGFEGTETQWLASLVGATGAQGEKGDKGDKGDTGAQGIQGERGLQGEQGIQGVKGDKGDKGDTGATGATGESGANGTDGQDGKSAYQIAVDNGFVGNVTQWLASLKGDKGDKGDTGESGTSASITANEVLTKLKTVDGQNSGLDADMLDGHDSTYFATATQNEGKADIEHTHEQSDITGLSSALGGKADVSHTHATSEITGLDTALSGKATTSHTHSLNDVSETTTKKIMTASERTKLNGIEAGANKTTVDGALSTTSSNPVQNKVVASALNNKVDKVTGKELSTNDYTTAEKNKLAGIAASANNYTHPSSHPASMITGLSDVATSGSYDDLSGKPEIPTVPASLPANGGNADTVDNKHASDFATAAHTHSQSEITGLATALNGKANANHTHNYCTLSQVYPVGAIYLSVNNTNPSSLFGGTWVAFGTGRVLMGVKSGGNAETTGGSETASISAHSHTTASHKLTIEEMPTHHHEILNYNENGVTTDTFTKNSVEGLIKKGWTGNVMTSYTGGNQAHSHGNTGSAGAATINVVQPYITCYMWKRTA